MNCHPITSEWRELVVTQQRKLLSFFFNVEMWFGGISAPVTHRASLGGGQIGIELGDEEPA